MSAVSKRRMIRFACIVLAGFALPAGSEVARAAEPQSPDQLIRALRPPVRATRGLTISPADATRNAEDARFVDTLRKRTTRSLTTEERDKITSIAQKKPSVDLEINFEYNSDRLSAKAMPQVSALGEALSSADLKGSTFIVAGHTDGKGGDTFNQGLSERRADALKRYLMDRYKIDDGRLVTVGYGKTQLKNPSNPTAAENRRVQVINVAN
ncbi:MAG TPA: OmpA family protein [Xanthobacteraceae bacterium]|nr:OmpA family protein [Xanthobacteraceae bacterium]